MRRSVAALLGWVLVALVAFLIVLAFQFNRMVVLRNRCKEAWANVDTELRRRHDLIPNLVAAVKGYMAHEQQVLLQVTEARQRALGAP
ncbi:MAG TPA: LemA family protein, partial [Candidatus Thermoplasmatota archaeon]|nr:LemA family protein [Candidatus Thermoplasmatota archaeon]